MNAEELLQAPYNPDNWSLARDLSNEIMEQYTQTFPVSLLPMPDDTGDNMWTKQHVHKKTLLNCRRYRHKQPFYDEWPYSRVGLPAHDDAKGWTSFLELQQSIYWLKIEYMDTGEPDHIMSAFMKAHVRGFFPPLWVLDHWMWPAFGDYTQHKGKKTLEDCMGLLGTQRAGNWFDKRKREEKSFYIRFQTHNLISATGLSIAKCSEILSLKVGMPAPATIATMYKKLRNETPEEIISMATYFEELIAKTGSDNKENPFINAEDPRKVFAIHGENFHAAAESKRSDMTVTNSDYESFLQKLSNLP